MKYVVTCNNEVIEECLTATMAQDVCDVMAHFDPANNYKVKEVKAV